jgi:acetate kinase
VGVSAESDDRTALCLNTGSSSLKAALVRNGETVQRSEQLVQGPGALRAAVDQALDGLLAGGAPDVVGHRVVHGGPDFSGPAIIDSEVLERIRALVDLAPLHQPAAVAAIELVQQRLPDVPSVACFDTAFHRRLPEAAQRLPLPARYWDAGVRRYGFHGLSYEYIVGHFGDRLGPRTVIAHLGSGASLVALRDRVPVDTSMSLTPGGGCVMATRSGELDPGVVLLLLTLESDREVGRVLEHESGMFGLSGSTGDARTLLERMERDDQAAQAIDAFVVSVAKYVAAFTTVLGGLDTLVFTGGIGAGSAEVRSAIAARLAHLGVVLRDDRNQRSEEVVSEPGSRCEVLVALTDEEAVIAKQALNLVLSEV